MSRRAGKNAESTKHSSSKIQTVRTQKPTRNAVYPLVYNRQLQDFDNWDHIIHVHVFQRLSVHDFPRPPKRVLELGCGTGIWVIDAAKQWKGTSFVGFDLAKLQPDLIRCNLHDLAPRVQWVQGDFLDPLPFPSEHFNFVRIHCIGLGVPENKWQGLLEEINRVLEPGGQLEITEEDQIFPCGSIPRDHESTSSLLIPQEITPNGSWEALSPTSSISENLKAGRTEFHSSGASGRNVQYQANPRDHRRIEACWQRMLRTRFISPVPLSVLSLYLSATFDHILPLPQLLIRMPPNSVVVQLASQDSRDSSSGANSFPDSRTMSFKVQPTPPVAPSTWEGNPSDYKAYIPSSSSAVNLARRFHTVAGCKEAMWAEYQTLYSASPTPCDWSSGQNTTRDEFEYFWLNWADDMQDRMCMRNVVGSALKWPIPKYSDPSSSVAWRARCGVIDASDTENDMDSESDDKYLCRSLRCFLAWKT